MQQTIDIYELSKEELIMMVMDLQHEMAVLKKMIFGSRHERFSPILPVSVNQLSLGIEVEKIVEHEVITTHVPAHDRVQVEKKEKIHPGRNPLPACLRREEVIIEPTEDVSHCVCIGKEITEILELTPASFYVKRIIRPKYARAHAEGVAIASLPNRVIDKGMLGASVLAMLIVDKFVDHLPVYRQQQRFQRMGVALNYNTLVDSINKSADILIPLYELHKRKVFESRYLMGDETTIKVLDDGKKGSTHCGYLWGFRCPEEKLIFFEYHPGRNMEVPAALLKGFTGHLQIDGYGAYDQFSSCDDITVLYCMAHARRHFSEAVDNDKKISEYALTEIQKLYKIEREIKDYSTEEKYTARQQRAVPILKSLGEWMVKQCKHPSNYIC